MLFRSSYIIAVTGSPATDFTAVGSPNNNVGTVFTATGGIESLINDAGVIEASMGNGDISHSNALSVMGGMGVNAKAYGKNPMYVPIVVGSITPKIIWNGWQSPDINKGTIGIKFEYITDDGSSSGGSGSSESQATTNAMSIVSFSHNLKVLDGELSSITLGLSGVDSNNYQSFWNLAAPNRITYDGVHYSNFYSTDNLSISIQFASDYSSVTYSWTNSGDITIDDDIRIDIMYGGSSVNSSSPFISLYVDGTSSYAIKDSKGLGQMLASISKTPLLSPPYLLAANGCNHYDRLDAWHTDGGGINSGPDWRFGANDITASEDLQKVRSHLGTLATNGDLGIGRLAVTYTKTVNVGNTVAYYAIDENETMDSNHRLYNEITSGRTESPTGYRIRGDIHPDWGFRLGYYEYDTGSSTSAAYPDENTTVTFYIYKEAAGSILGEDYCSDAAATDIKIVLELGAVSGSDYAAIGRLINTSYYRNANTVAGGAPSWTQVDRLYLGGQVL